VTQPESGTRWWAKGLIFENCNCQLVCPGHIHFEQLCTHERCRGYWAFRFDEGEVEGSALAGRRAVVAFDSPRRMVDGGWTQILLLDEETSEEMRQRLERLFAGELGGPWSVLSRFVGQRLPTRCLPMEFTAEPMKKGVSIPGILNANVEAIRGRIRGEPVRFENIFNQIHAPSQTIAFGTTDYDDGTIRFETEKTHGLWSEFEWRVSPE
jgi:hypothetical protein